MSAGEHNNEIGLILRRPVAARSHPASRESERPRQASAKVAVTRELPRGFTVHGSETVCNPQEVWH